MTHEDSSDFNYFSFFVKQSTPLWPIPLIPPSCLLGYQVSLNQYVYKMEPVVRTNMEGFLIHIPYPIIFSFPRYMQMSSFLTISLKVIPCTILRDLIYATSELSYHGTPNDPVTCQYFLTGYVVYCISFLKLSQFTNLTECTPVHLPLYRVSNKSVNTRVRHKSVNIPLSHEWLVVRTWLAVYSGCG